ncbi:MAG: hypothetical protein SR1Q7_03305 [Quinella sp. 1Q7]|nr:hypothetical protein [Quinella sp. 1Q7]
MRKFFLLTALLMMILTTTAFAAEDESAAEPASDEPYVYTSEDFKFSITCPIKPIAVVENPWQETDKRGEMLVFANDGFEVLYGYVIQVNAFDSDKVPDFNKGSMKEIGDYLLDLKKKGGFESADLVNLTKHNKGVFAVSAKTIEVLDDNGEVEGEFVADKQYLYTFFRTPEGRCIGIQLISANLEDKQYVDTYRYGVATFKDNSGDKKSKKSDKKSKKSDAKPDKKSDDK